MAGDTPIEVELKLLFKPGQQDRLLHCVALAEWQQGPASRQSICSNYYDTPDLDLAGAGISFHVRALDGAYLQTLTANPDDKLQRSHAEWEWALSCAEPMPSLAASTPLAATLSDAVELLEPIFTTAFERSKLRLGRDDAAAELRIDVGEIRAANRKQALHELELGLIKGSPAFLYEIALSLHRQSPLQLAADTKPKRGYTLLTGEKQSWQKRSSVALKPKWSAETAFQTIMRANLGMFLANRDCAALGEDPKGIHQARVALRRIRSAFSLFRDCLPIDSDVQALKNEVKWLANAMGPARDWDVFLGETLPPVMASADHDEGLEALLTSAQTQRDKAQAEASKALHSPRTTDILLTLGHWVENRGWRRNNTWTAQTAMESPVTKLAKRQLQKRWKKVAGYGNRFEQLNIEQRHEMRIEVKKMRYASDFFASLYERKQVKTFRRSYAYLQDALGLLNDIAVTEQLLGGLTSRRPIVLKAMGRVCGWQQHIAELEMARVADYWKELAELERFWRNRG